MAEITDLSLLKKNTCEEKPITHELQSQHSSRSCTKHEKLEIVKNLQFKKRKSVGKCNDGKELQNVLEVNVKDLNETHNNDSETPDTHYALDPKCKNLENTAETLQLKPVKSAGKSKDKEELQNEMRENLKLKDLNETKDDKSKPTNAWLTFDENIENLEFRNVKSTGDDKFREHLSGFMQENMNEKRESLKKDNRICNKSENSVTEVTNNRVSVLYSHTKQYEVIFYEFIQYLRRQLSHVYVLNNEDQIAFREKVSNYESLFELFKKIQFTLWEIMKQDHETKYQNDENYFDTLMAKCDEMEALYYTFTTKILEI